MAKTQKSDKTIEAAAGTQTASGSSKASAAKSTKKTKNAAEKTTAAKSTPAKKSCCASGQGSACTDPESDEPPALSACTCGGGPSGPGLPTTGDPRLLTDVAGIPANWRTAKFVPPSELTPPSRSIPPGTPPPKVPAALSSPV